MALVRRTAPAACKADEGARHWQLQPNAARHCARSMRQARHRRSRRTLSLHQQHAPPTQVCRRRPLSGRRTLSCGCTLSCSRALGRSSALGCGRALGGSGALGRSSALSRCGALSAAAAAAAARAAAPALALALSAGLQQDIRASACCTSPTMRGRLRRQRRAAGRMPTPAVFPLSQLTDTPHWNSAHSSTNLYHWAR